MNFIQPIFVNQTDSILQGKLGLENASFPLTDVCERIQKDIDVGVSDFLLFVTANTKTDSVTGNSKHWWKDDQVSINK